MDRHRTLHTNARILEEASTWFVELGEGDVSASAREEFTAWLRASPEHVRAYLQISAVWEDAPLLGKGRERPDDIDALIARARSGVNIVPLATCAPCAGGKSPTGANRGMRRTARLALAASILVAVVVPGLWVSSHAGYYSTGIGETRWVNLADGSTIELDAQSRIHVRLTRTARDVDLLAGRALFHVAKDPGRPFVVRSGTARITDIGTVFDVYRRSTDTVVTVIEGRVAVRTTPILDGSSLLMKAPPMASVALSHLGMRAPGIMVTAGEQVDLTPKVLPRPTRVDVRTATAWTRQKLVFDSAPLSEVVAQYNLYHEKRLVIRDPALSSYHLSGVFSAVDSTALVAFLRAQPTLAVKESENEIDISSRQ